MSTDDELEKIRQQKREQIRAQLEGGQPAGEQSRAAPDEPIHVRDAAHLNEVVDSYDVVLADFYADWCGPCKMLEPIVQAVARETPAAVAKVDIDANQAIARQNRVQSVPTLFLYADGEPAKRMVGVQDQGTLTSLIQQYS